MTHLTFAEAIIVGLIQGTTELFPVSSLGHNVLIPALVQGSWARDLNVSAKESPYLAFVVGLHVATAIALTHDMFDAALLLGRDAVALHRRGNPALRAHVEPLERNVLRRVLDHVIGVAAGGSR